MKIKVITIFSMFLFVFRFTPSFAATYSIQTKTSHCIVSALPDSACSPGAILTTDIKTICTVGYTKTVRDVSVATKKKVFQEYDIPYTQHSNYEVDHIISLEIGGSNDISNLFPESYLTKNGARVKDVFENYLHKQVCSDLMTIIEAQKEISTDWLAYNTARLNQIKTPFIKVTPSKVKITAPQALTSPVYISTPIIQAPVSTTHIQTLTAPVAEPAVKKSSTGLCHAQGTRYYNQTLNYTSYVSISDCLASGGRLPK